MPGRARTNTERNLPLDGADEGARFSENLDMSHEIVRVTSGFIVWPSLNFAVILNEE